MPSISTLSSIYLHAETINLGTNTSISCETKIVCICEVDELLYLTWLSSRLISSLLRSLSLLPKILPEAGLEAPGVALPVAGVENGTKLFLEGFGVSSRTSIPRIFSS